MRGASYSLVGGLIILGAFFSYQAAVADGLCSDINPGCHGPAIGCSPGSTLCITTSNVTCDDGSGAALYTKNGPPPASWFSCSLRAGSGYGNCPRTAALYVESYYFPTLSACNNSTPCLITNNNCCTYSGGAACN